MEPHMDHGPLHEREPHHTSFGPGHQTVAEGDQGEQPHEKKSVFTKVKAKARKIKDTLTGHGHDNENDLDEEDDEDDQEKFEDPQIHDAPKYDTAGQVGNLGTSRVDHGRSTAMDVDPLETNVKPGSNFDGQERTKGQHKVTLGSVIGEDITHASQKKPVTRYDDATTGIHDHQTKDNVPSNTGMGDLPHEPPFHSPGISHGRDNVPVKGDVLEPPGIHHHSSRDNVPSTRTSDDNVVDRPGIHHKIRDDVSSRTTATDNLERPKGQEEDFAAPKDSFGDYTSANYQTKVTDPTGKGGEAAGVASILQSFEKMKVKDGSEGVGKTRQEHNLPAGRKEDHLPTSVAPTGSHDQFSPELTPPKHLTAGQETFDSPQEHDYLHEHELGTDHRPPSNQSSSYIDKISSPTTAIADKAVSPKNVVGDNDSTTGVHDHEGVGGKPSSDQSSYTEKLSYATSVIADRAISAKNVVALKLGYGEKDSEVPGTGTFSTANQQQQQEGVEGNNQERGGGGSVKGYLAEKLRPGEEDKALSEVITETLHKPKPEQQQQQQLKQESPRPVREVVSDAMHKRNDDPDGEVNRPMGKVTESDEVARRLGHTQDDQALGNKGMVDKIKGAVGSWLGKGDQSPGKGDQSPRSQTGSARDDTGHNSN